ncbi:MAG: hypothetical protein A2051_07490 [Desulfovibrionales bacterium GWA2_65_9]|nr:MAG: hypothetical protein A2051_07490 [Desulfovibrionales bacterium GWA2_65_9]
MHCIILLPDAAGRVATAQELRQLGFAISAAVGPPSLPRAAGDAPAGHCQTAMAAEEPAAYGESRSLKL